MVKKIGLYIVFIGSIALFFGASFILYQEYIAYKERVKRYTKAPSINTEQVNPLSFPISDANSLENLRDQRNILFGYETFLKESAINYNPGSFSYANILKEKFISQLDNIKFTQPYWDAILTSFYTNIYSENKNYLDGYDAIMRIPTTYVNEDIEGIEDIEIIEKISTEEYWKQQVFQFDRSAQNIEKIWNKNKAFFYTFMSKAKYDTRCKNIITDLIEIHGKITSDPNYIEFYKTYDVTDSIFHTFPTTEYVSAFEYSWPFSFWDRRFTEKSDEVVYKILEEINNHYEN